MPDDKGKGRHLMSRFGLFTIAKAVGSENRGMNRAPLTFVFRQKKNFPGVEKGWGPIKRLFSRLFEKPSEAGRRFVLYFVYKLGFYSAFHSAF